MPKISRSFSKDLAALAVSTATDIMRSSSFHDLEKWSEEEEARRRGGATSSNEELSLDARLRSSTVESDDRPRRISRKASLEVLRAIAPELSNEDGTARAAESVHSSQHVVREAFWREIGRIAER